ncbi:hypothetical protein O1Q96_20140 [Streptomyces sp. Qhu-G9]|uniref:hypothetical protein n=1 Tax=Streptomyces sp. Qhu-G9 TaxID=3452799 RepID=UPI0022AC157E|nr:hypothetical protein [Streptomyces aurantiacus]WAU81893.1 hypothetical protein O1Q96_20140 [Streptomyces aurantiacus]
MVAALLCSGFAAGCSAGSSPAAPALADAELRTELTGDEKALLHLAEQRLIADCMDEQGFRYVVEELPRSSTSPRAASASRQGDVAWARANGYGTAPGDAASGQGKRALGPNGRYIVSLTPEKQRAFSRALDGTNPSAVSVEVPTLGRVFTSADGCQANARTRLYGDQARWVRAKATVTNLRAITRENFSSDPEYTAALSEWRSCMAERGHSARTPAEARRTALSKRAPAAGAATVSAGERRTAVADARCSRSTRLAAVTERVEERHVQTAARGAQRGAAEDYTVAVTRALDLAQEPRKAG